MLFGNAVAAGQVLLVLALCFYVLLVEVLLLTGLQVVFTLNAVLVLLALLAADVVLVYHCISPF